MLARVAVQYITISGFPSDKVSSNKERGLRMFSVKSFGLKTISNLLDLFILELPGQPLPLWLISTAACRGNV